MAVLLALCSAIVYGTADYCGGHASRRWPSPAVAAFGQAIGLGLLLVVLPILGDPLPPAADWGWGALAGLAGVIGLVCFYRALADGAMTVVAPITAAVSAVVPLVAGLVQGERPGTGALTGVVLALLAIVLVSGALGSHPEARPTPPAVMALAFVAGLGFGMLFVCLDHTSSGSGLWPFVPMRLVSIPVAFAIAFPARRLWATSRPPRALVGFVVASGVLDMSANVLFLLATRRGLLSVVGVISSLYPASTVVLAYWRDGERMTRWQIAGLGVTGLALVLVGIG